MPELPEIETMRRAIAPGMTGRTVVEVDVRQPKVVADLDAEEFVAVKGFKAKGKRVSSYEIDSVNELEPTRFATPEAEAAPIVSTDEEPESEPTDEQSTADILDEITGQMKLFDE